MREEEHRAALLYSKKSEKSTNSKWHGPCNLIKLVILVAYERWQLSSEGITIR